MSVTVRIVEGALSPAKNWSDHEGAGALLTFDGIVRPMEADQPILALDYEAYLPMAEDQLRELAKQITSNHGLIALDAHHSHGRVNVGECSFRLRVASRHRQEGLAAMAEFIDRLKQDVPIWKTAVYRSAGAGGTA